MVSDKGENVKIIGLTGGIASGKSTVSNILKGLGAHIIDADRIARDVVAPGSDALAEIVAFFGEGVISSDGFLKRGELSRIVFNDPDALRTLNGITHPRIVEAIHTRIQKESMCEDILILDAALLIELKLGSLVDETWLICVQPETQIERLLRRENMSRADAEKIIRAQLPLDEKMKVADVCIDNNGSMEDLQNRIKKLWNEQVKT